MIKLIHTADIHLDACFANAGMPPQFGNLRRQSLRDVLAGILARTKDSKADALLIAGDLFEHDRVTRDTLGFLRERFAAVSPIPIFIAPGNHDPYLPESPYATELWPENVHVFREPAWSAVELQDIPLTVHGFAFDGYEISKNPFGTLEIPKDGRRHVALGHGSEQGHQPEGKSTYAPFEARHAVTPHLDYLALGHFHGLTHVKGDFGTKVFYSGAPEGHNFKETGPHYVLEIELLGEDGGNQSRKVKVTPVPASKVQYETLEIDCGEMTSTQQLIEALRAKAGKDGSQRIVRCTLTGECDTAFQDELSSVADAAASLFLFFDLVDQTHPAADATDAEGSTSLAGFLQRMEVQIADAPDAARRAMLVRAREVGLAAYQDRDLPIRGIEGGGA